MKKFYKTYKEELLALPLLIIGIMVFKFFLNTIYPDSAQYDLASETETIFWAIIKLIVFTSASWMALRIVFPKSYFYLKNKFYHDFEELKQDNKREISLKLFFAFLFALVFLSSGFSQEQKIRRDLNYNLEQQLNVRELTNNNDGHQVEIYLASVGLNKGYPWCAAFTTYNLDQLNISNPKSAWSPDWAREKDIIWSQKLVKTHKIKQKPQTGDCFTIYYNKLKRVGHVGFVIGRSSNGYFNTIEGNTNNNGSRQGIGVFKRKRHPKKVYAITNYITNEKNNSNYSINKYYNYQQQLQKSKRVRNTTTSYRFNKSNYKNRKKRYTNNNTSRFDKTKNTNRQVNRKADNNKIKTDKVKLTKGWKFCRGYLYGRRTREKNRTTRDNNNTRERAAYFRARTNYNQREFYGQNNQFNYYCRRHYNCYRNSVFDNQIFI